MRRVTMAVLLALAAVALPIAGCRGGGATASAQDEVVIRAYDVPEGVDSGRLATYVQASLGRDESARGTAVDYHTGTIVVTAPESVQRGIAAVIAEVAKTAGPPKSAPTSYAVRYWVLLARPATGGPKVAAELRNDADAKSAIDAIVAAQGPMEFAPLERARLESVEGYDATFRGRKLDIHQRVVTVPAGGILAKISLALVGSSGLQHSLETWARIDPGKVVVLGQSAYNAKGGVLPDGWRDPDDVSVYFVLSSDRE